MTDPTTPPTGGLVPPPPTAPPPPPNASTEPVAAPPVDAPPAPAPLALTPELEALIVAKVEALLAPALGSLASSSEAAQEHVATVIGDFETAVNTSWKRVQALVAELEKGGLVARLHELEMAVASFAGTALHPHNPELHDSQGLLINWFAGVKDVFGRVAAGFAQAKAKAQADVNAAAPPAPAPTPTPAVSPATSSVAALGLPPGALSSVPPGGP